MTASAVMVNVLSRLEGVRRVGAGFVARCPAHDDRDPSLGVDEGDDGRVLLLCRAGCDTAAVLAELKLDAADLFVPKTNGNGSTIVANYDYTDEIGTLLFQVVRFSPKDFRQRRPDGHGGWIWKLGDVRRVLFNLPGVVDGVNQGVAIYVTEGERDALALGRAGEVATCNPGGAGKWRSEYADVLKGAKVVVVADKDVPGRAHAAEVARSLQGVAASVVVVEPAAGKDAHDHFAAGYGVDAFVPVGDAGNHQVLPKRAEMAPREPADLHDGGDYMYTDYGNAERLVAKHGEDLRFDHNRGRWLVWDGRRWADDDTGEAVRRAKATARGLWADLDTIGDEKARKEAAKHAARSESEGRIHAALNLAASEPGIAARVEELDADPFALTCLNGTLDLRTGTLRPHRRGDLITKLVPVVFDINATCPAWLAFLDRIMAGNTEVIAFLRRAVGYSLTGLTVEQVMFLLHGVGANGKTTFLESLRALLGDYAQQTPSETLMAKREGSIPNDVARLRGARLVSAVETDEGRRLAEVMVKQVTGGDTISARYMRAEWFEFTPQCKVWLATNHRPVIRGTDDAIWRRLRLIPFAVTIPEGERDTTLPARLQAELPGVLSWAVQGCLEWQSHGLGVPDDVRSATSAYRTEMDVLGGFLADECIQIDDAWVAAGTLYDAYKRWCEAAGEHVVSQRRLGAALTERGFERRKYGAERRWCWFGIGLVNPSEDPRTHETHVSA